MVAEIRKRRDLFVDKLKLHPGFRCQSPPARSMPGEYEDTGNAAEEVQVALEESRRRGIAGQRLAAEAELPAVLTGYAPQPTEDALERIQRFRCTGVRRFAMKGRSKPATLRGKMNSWKERHLQRRPSCWRYIRLGPSRSLPTGDVNKLY